MDVECNVLVEIGGLPFNITSLVAGPLTGDTNERSRQGCIALGSEDGKIRLFRYTSSTPTVQSNLELFATLPNLGAISCMLLKSSNSGAEHEENHPVELIVGSMDGTVSRFRNMQLLSTTKFPSSVTHLAVCSYAARSTLRLQERKLRSDDYQSIEQPELISGDSYPVAADIEGNLAECAISPVSGHGYQGKRWKINIADLEGSERKQHLTNVTCMASVSAPDPSDIIATYLLVALTNKKVLIMSQGKIFQSVDMPTVITSICSGNFWLPTRKYFSKVIMSGEDGQIFGMAQDWSFVSILRVPFSIVVVLTLPFQKSANITQGNASSLMDKISRSSDLIVVQCYASRWFIVRGEEIVASFTESDWVCNIAIGTAQIEEACDMPPQIVVVTADQSIRIYQTRFKPVDRII